MNNPEGMRYFARNGRGLGFLGHDVIVARRWQIVDVPDSGEKEDNASGSQYAAMIHSAGRTPMNAPSIPANTAPNAMHEYVSV